MENRLKELREEYKMPLLMNDEDVNQFFRSLFRRANIQDDLNLLAA